FQEIMIFGDHLNQNKTWLDRLFNTEYADYVEHDFSEFVLNWESMKQQRKLSERLKIANVRNCKCITRLIVGMRLLRRLESIMISYVIVSRGGAGFDIVAEQLRLCRLSRAISAGLIIITFEQLAMFLYNFRAMLSYNWAELLSFEALLLLT